MVRASGRHRAAAGAAADRGGDKERSRVMIEKFAKSRRPERSEFLDLNHTRKIMILVSLLIPKLARDASIEVGRTSE
jgi:hypothetical protein